MTYTYVYSSTYGVSYVLSGSDLYPAAAHFLLVSYEQHVALAVVHQVRQTLETTGSFTHLWEALVTDQCKTVVSVEGVRQLARWNQCREIAEFSL